MSTFNKMKVSKKKKIKEKDLKKCLQLFLLVQQWNFMHLINKKFAFWVNLSQLPKVKNQKKKLTWLNILILLIIEHSNRNKLKLEIYRTLNLQIKTNQVSNKWTVNMSQLKGLCKESHQIFRKDWCKQQKLIDKKYKIKLVFLIKLSKNQENQA